ncbi:hypothetical protein CDAR_74981 [Caerostris darwini]|uniref:Uncharacterized protein n=1 Tax=Caerostris darwini TaxID=1538125 RepID=A0AAV4P0K2_9ARAC|nr:hypothetical protein CDAR_74981 [Caerostris darwini]
MHCREFTSPTGCQDLIVIAKPSALLNWERINRSLPINMATLPSISMDTHYPAAGLSGARLSGDGFCRWEKNKNLSIEKRFVELVAKFTYKFSFRKHFSFFGFRQNVCVTSRSRIESY